MPNMKTLPDRMKKLPIDERGYVVPWFVDWIDGKPEFRAMDRSKFIRAIRDRLCWTCGEKLGRHLAFVAGPMYGTTRTTSEPPNHYECALWSVQNCPFLSNPRMVRREGGLPPEATAENAPGIALMRNPGVAMIWVTRGYEKFRDAKGMTLLTMGEPDRVEWWQEGRRASREEVQISIDSGLPNLMALAKSEGSFAVEALGKAVRLLDHWLPQEVSA